MTRTSPLLAAFLAVSGASAQTTHTLTNAGLTFNPALITLNAGDSIHLVLPPPHTCRQVDQATWDANGNTSNGGFDYPSGDTTFVLDTPGTYYYVCFFHAGMGMKGRFIVLDASGVGHVQGPAKARVLPNPANDRIRITGLEPGQRVRVFDMAMRQVLDVTPSAEGMVDVTPLPPGNYNLSWRNVKDSHTTTLPLVIAR